MRHDDEEEYLRLRAEVELELAQRATKAEVVHAHYVLAEAYLERLKDLMDSSNSGP